MVFCSVILALSSQLAHFSHCYNHFFSFSHSPVKWSIYWVYSWIQFIITNFLLNSLSNYYRMHFITISRRFFLCAFYANFLPIHFPSESTLSSHALIILLRENSKTIFQNCILLMWTVYNGFAWNKFHSLYFGIRSSWQAVFKKRIKQISYYHILINETFFFLLKRKNFIKCFIRCILVFSSHNFFSSRFKLNAHTHTPLNEKRKSKIKCS